MASAAKTSASPKLRVAIEAAAEDADDDEVTRAVDALKRARV